MNPSSHELPLTVPMARPRPGFAPSLVLSERARIMLVVLVALFQGLLHLFLLPPWQHYDEPTHFEHAWLIANRGVLRPTIEMVDSPMRRDVAASMFEHDFYLGIQQPELLREWTGIWIGILELAHPPVYYFMVSLPLRLVRYLDMTTQLYVARSVSLVLFLLTVLVTCGLMRDLARPQHPLRWAVPLTLVLLPPFASHMTAVNNDVGGVFTLSLFAWGAVRMIRLGLTWQRLLWVVGSAVLSILTKNTAAISLLLVPVVLAFAWWVQRGWRWRWLWLPVLGALLLGMITVMEWGDAAYWYREQFTTAQDSATRQAMEEAPFGSHALIIEAVGEEPLRRLMNPFLREDVPRIQGQAVTVGGWVWADREAEVAGPGILWDEATGTSIEALYHPVTVTTVPTLVTRTLFVTETTGVAYYGLLTVQPTPQMEPFNVYLDGAFAVVGELPAGTEPVFEGAMVTAGNNRYMNLVRNGSFEQGGPRLRPWVERTLFQYARRSPTFVLSALFDVQRNARWLAGTVTPLILWDFFSAFAWGHVRLTGPYWPLARGVLVGMALLGAGKWLAQSRRERQLGLYPALFLLAGIAVIVWLNAIIWPLAFNWGRIPMPVGRYVYPAIIPMALVLAGGWWAIWPRRLRLVGTWAFLGGLVVLNVISVAVIGNYYRALGSL